MPDNVFIAVFGLLLLVPLEIAFLIVLAALKRRPEGPKIVVPEPKKQEERYGWEDYLKLPVKEKKESGNNVVLAVIVLVAAVLLVAVPSYMFGIPQALFNATANETIEEVGVVDVEEPEPEVEVAPGNLSLNITLPSLNFSMPDLNISGLREKAGLYKPYIYAVIIAVAVLAAALAVFMYMVKKRKLAVIHKASKTADKLMGKKSNRKLDLLAKLRAIKFPSVKLLKPIRPYLAPLVILFLLVIIALLVYLLRDRISTEFADLVLRLIIKAKAFALTYRLYIIAGVLSLIVAIMALRHLSKKRN